MPLPEDRDDCKEHQPHRHTHTHKKKKKKTKERERERERERASERGSGTTGPTLGLFGAQGRAQMPVMGVRGAPGLS